jgi:hypothetical protein
VRWSLACATSQAPRKSYTVCGTTRSGALARASAMRS